LFWPNQPDVWVDVSSTLDRKIAALRAHGSQIKHPERLEERIRAWAKEEGESVGVEAAEALRAVVIDEDEDDAEGPTHTDEAPSEAPGPTHEHAATLARSPDTTT
jgi:hypothetical protein